MHKLFSEDVFEFKRVVTVTAAASVLAEQVHSYQKIEITTKFQLKLLYSVSYESVLNNSHYS